MNHVWWVSVSIAAGDIYVFSNILTPTVILSDGILSYQKFFRMRWSHSAQDVYAKSVGGGDFGFLPALRFYSNNGHVLGDVPLSYFCGNDKHWLLSFKRSDAHRRTP
jgi:hypothetical protein